MNWISGKVRLSYGVEMFNLKSGFIEIHLNINNKAFIDAKLVTHKKSSIKPNHNLQT